MYVDLVIRCGTYVYMNVMELYEFSNNCKVRMVLLHEGLCWVRVKRLLSAIRLWHELSKNDLTQGFVKWVKLLLVSL